MAAEQHTRNHGPGGQAWKPAHGAAWVRNPEGETVVMGLEAGRPQLLSPSAGVVWGCLLGGLGPEDDLAEAVPRTEAEIVADVAAAFGLPEAEVTEGVTAFLRMLEASGVAERI